MDEEQENQDSDAERVNNVETGSLFELARKMEIEGREALGDEVSIDGFQPAEAVWVVNALISRKYGGMVGGIVSTAYAQSTLILAVAVWLAFFYILTFPNTGEINQATWALFSVTIGTFVLISGSNLVDRYGEENLNFLAFVHNSIIFTASGVLFALSHIAETYLGPVEFSLSYELLPNLLLVLTNLVGSLLFVLSIWLLLKILWRLNQLVQWGSDYPDKSPYAELRGAIWGFYWGLTKGGEISLLRVMISSGIIIVAFLIPYYWKSDLLWGLAGVLALFLVNLIIGILARLFTYVSSRVRN